MAVSADWKFILCLWTGLLQITGLKGLQICPDGYICHEGHCCGQGRCCTSYYDIWWVWVIWIMLGLLGICCFYHHKRMRDMQEQGCGGRHGQQRHRPNPQLTSDTISTQDTSQLLPNAEKIFYLPSYEDIADQPKEPPEYSMMYQMPQSLVQCQVPADETLAPPALGAPPTYSSDNIPSLCSTHPVSQPVLPCDVPSLCESVRDSTEQSHVTNTTSVTARLLPEEDAD